MADIAARSELDSSRLRELERRFRGRLVAPGHEGYEEGRRVWNGSIDRFPALIASCADPSDVAAALGFARDTGLPVAIRGGGHSFPGLSTCDGGVVIDLSPLKRIELDPKARVARAGAGVLLGELDAATQTHGLAVPAGIVTHTGLSGLTLGGGIGWLMRKHGLTVDQLTSVEMVTVDGERVRASESENSDLFWGVRGGGGNFGIVTSFEFRLVPVGPIVLAGPVFWPIEDSPAVLRFYRDWIAEAPDELMTIVVHRKAPPAPWVPAELQGRHVVAVICCWAGRVEDGERAVRPLKRFRTPALDLCEPKAFVAHQAFFDPSFVPGRWYYMRACDVDSLTDEIIDLTVEHSRRIRSPLTSFPIWQLGGAVARVPEDETPFNSRSAGHTFNITASTEGPDGFDEEREWVREFSRALDPHARGVYVNFLMNEGGERVRQAYGDAKFARLQALKRRYDPANVLRLNQNVPPA